MGDGYCQPVGFCSCEVGVTASARSKRAASAQVGLPFAADREIGEFWTSQQRQAHSLHEVSYRACFKPQLPAYFMQRYTEPGDVVYDPFMGRGTVPLEAEMQSRVGWGSDANPLSALLAGPRLAPPTMEQVSDRLRGLLSEPLRDDAVLDEVDLRCFFHPQTLREIAVLREAWHDRQQAGTLDAVDGWIRMVALSRLTGHSPGFFSVRTMPPNQAVSAAVQRKLNTKLSQTPSPRDVQALILRKTKSLLRSRVTWRPSGRSRTWHADSRQSGLPDGCVDLVVTSPPFLDVVDYASDNWLRCWFAGIDVKDLDLDVHKTIATWTAFVRATLTELARVVRPGGHVAFEVGEVRSGAINLEEHVETAAADTTLDPVKVMIHKQEFTKTAHLWGVANNTRGTNTQRIVVMRNRQE